MSVYEEDAYPWLVAEKRAIREAVTTGCPYFGVCLGSQLLASALGSRVFRGPEPELGVNPIFLCEAARRDPVFRAFPPRHRGDASFTPTHSTCPRARCASPAPPATKTRRSMWGGPRMRSSAIWSPRSTTSVTGSTLALARGDVRGPLRTWLCRRLPGRVRTLDAAAPADRPSAVPPLAGECPRPRAIGLGCEQRGNGHGPGSGTPRSYP